MSIAVMREYGGLNSGNPSGICRIAARRLHVEQVAVERRVGRGAACITACALRDGM